MKFTDDLMRKYFYLFFTTLSFLFAATEDQFIEVSYKTVYENGAENCTPHLVRAVRHLPRKLSNIALEYLINSFPNLQEINLSNQAYITPNSVTKLYKLKSLESLDLGTLRTLPVKLILKLSTLPKLKSLNLRLCPQLTDEFIVDLIKNCPQLAELDIRLCPGITDKSLQALAGLAHLELLKLGQFGGITDEGVCALAASKTLAFLDLDMCVKLTGASIAALSSLQTLKHLNLWYCTQYTGKDIMPLAGMKNLILLNLTGCTQVSFRTLKALKGTNPNLKVIMPPYSDRVMTPHK